ncbi:DUF3169 family protein [Streptococcus sp. LYSM12]|uniref:DUF3169 family protein n=2 Tax=unclassified Streptococcus TaxID=2608887 RepID=UPI00142FA931|nr:DUF3169 family protein [Streptococcus sp. LYSM12]
MNERKEAMKKQGLKYFSKYMMAGLLCGFLGTFIAGIVIGYTGEYFSLTTLREPLLWISRAALVLITGWSLYLMQVASQSYDYDSKGDLEEENDGMLYRKTFRSLEYAHIGFNVAQVLTILNILLSIRGALTPEGLIYEFTFLDLGSLVIVTLLQIFLVRVIRKVRGHQISAFPTSQEMKEYIYSYDEGEKESIFENSFLILFQLNQQVLPIVYIVLFVLSIITGEIQFIAYLVVAFIHIYINMKQFKQVQSYFK